MLIFKKPIPVRAFELGEHTSAELGHRADKAINLIREPLWRGLPESCDDNSIATYLQHILEYFYMPYQDAA